MSRAYFCAYYSYSDQLEELTDEEVGRLFRAVFRYASYGEVPQLTGNERFVFPAIRGQIDRDVEKYEALCEKNRENALLRSQANAAKEKENETEKENGWCKEKDRRRYGRYRKTPEEEEAERMEELQYYAKRAYRPES